MHIFFFWEKIVKCTLRFLENIFFLHKKVLNGSFSLVNKLQNVKIALHGKIEFRLY